MERGSNSHASEQKREVDQRLVELQSLFEMSQILNSSLHLHSVLNSLLLTPMGRMMISRGMVLIAREDKSLTIEVAKGLPRELLGRKYAFACRDEQPVLVREMDGSGTGLKNFLENHGLELVVPIVSSKQAIGLLCLGRKLDGRPFSTSEIEFLNSLSNIAATSIENALIYHQLEEINRRLDKKVQELNTLFEIGQELNSTLDTEKITRLLIYAIMGELLVNRCFVIVLTPDTCEIYGPKGRMTEEQSVRALRGQRFQKSLRALREPFIVEEERLPRNLKTISRMGLCVVVPMRNQEETKGVVLLGEKITGKAFQTDELEFLSTLSNQAIISIENARLFEETLEKQRMEEELNIARDIQQRLFPATFPRPQGYEIKGINIPSRQVGGDYFDCIRLDDDHIALAIADVSGKGVPASLLMSNLQAGLHSLVSSHADISAIAGKLNNFLYAHTSFDKFITFFYCEVDLKDSTLTYVNAGHNPPYLYHADGTHRTLETGGLLLGMMPDMPYETETISLRPGDLLLMFTDGVTEAKNLQDEEFEEWRLEAVLKESRHLPVDELLQRIIRELNEFAGEAPQADDITMLALRVLPEPSDR